jgi:hypothetical protein
VQSPEFKHQSHRRRKEGREGWRDRRKEGRKERGRMSLVAVHLIL